MVVLSRNHWQNIRNSLHLFRVDFKRSIYSFLVSTISHHLVSFLFCVFFSSFSSFDSGTCYLLLLTLYELMHHSELYPIKDFVHVYLLYDAFIARHQRSHQIKMKKKTRRLLLHCFCSFLFGIKTIVIIKFIASATKWRRSGYIGKIIVL